MPYTPPTQRSPASSKPNSPILSRSQSYVNDTTLNHSGPTARPSLPRSISSTAYLNKHRRAPSISQQQNGNQNAGSPPQEQANKRTPTNGSLRQSPSPVNNLLIPTGAITTPPDSASDDEERGRQLGDLVELQEALQSITQKREQSPERNVDGVVSKSEPQAVVAKPTPPPRPLTPEARKISHSRSSSEIQLSSLAPDMAIASVDNTSEDSDDEEDGLRIKPPLVRKKSGELVKPALRPTSRRRPSSMPGTPTFSKAVHFNDNIEQVRHFLQVDRPIAVSAGSSPVETYDSESDYPFDAESGYNPRKVEWDIQLANFPRETFERKTLPVRVERIFLAADNKTLVGTVAVANIAFHKLVVARFTLDYWKTTSEVIAEYNNDVRKKQLNDGYDRFNFNIKLADQANLESKTLLVCVRYSVNGTDYWDNNNNMNYQVDFTRKNVPKGALRGGKPSKPSVSIPRSRHSPGGGRPRSYPSAFEDDFSNGFDNKYQFGTTKVVLTDQPHTSIRLRNKAHRTNLEQGLRNSGQQGSLGFSNRYDFASKSAASTASPTGLTPASISSEKPDLKSAEYNELIQKFCFFGSASGKSSPLSAPQTPSSAGSSTGTQNSSASSTTNPSKESSPQMDGANDAKYPRISSNFLSRSTSPGPFTGSDFPERTRSPMNFGYPYNHAMQGGLFGESHTPQAILG